ncbi:MAG TPA: Spy/CpxP family protein refolding chaperone [Planktothrix sp.]|jgi:Spy/CpxP family protein refolding chaperone
MKYNVICNLALALSVFAAPAFAADSLDNSDMSQLASTPRTAVVTAEGEDADGKGGEGKGWRHGPNFTDDQLEKMAALKDQYMQKTASQKDQIRLLHRQLREALAKENVDRSGAQSILSQINSIHSDLASKGLDFKLDMMNILTPEQREHMRRHMLMANAFGGGHHHHGRGGCGGGHERGHGGPGGPGGKHHHGHGGPEGAEAPASPEAQAEDG